jgi:hypothetical protein
MFARRAANQHVAAIEQEIEQEIREQERPREIREQEQSRTADEQREETT